jgi:hypothetical protein
MGAGLIFSASPDSILPFTNGFGIYFINYNNSFRPFLGLWGRASVFVFSTPFHGIVFLVKRPLEAFLLTEL